MVPCHSIICNHGYKCNCIAYCNYYLYRNRDNKRLQQYRHNNPNGKPTAHCKRGRRYQSDMQRFIFCINRRRSQHLYVVTGSEFIGEHRYECNSYPDDNNYLYCNGH